MPFLVEPAIIFILKIYVKFYFIFCIYFGLKSSNIWNYIACSDPNPKPIFLLCCARDKIDECKECV